MSTERAVIERAKALRTEQNGLLAKAKALLDRAEAAERDLTPPELHEWRGWLDRVDAIQRELDASLDVRIAAERAGPDAQLRRWKKSFFRP